MFNRNTVYIIAELSANHGQNLQTAIKLVEEAFEAGATVEYLQQNYRGLENKPLSQWKAHVTMGTYNTQKL